MVSTVSTGALPGRSQPTAKPTATGIVDHATSLRPIHIGAAFPVGRGAEVPATVNMQLNVTPEDQGFEGDGPLVWSWSMAPDPRTGRWLITDEATG